MMATFIRVLICSLLIALTAPAQEALSGHWTGSIELPNMSMAVEIDLDKTAKGWVGSMAVPVQNSAGLPLESIAFTDGKASWKIKGVPGDPTFTGTLSADGKTLAGDFTQGGGTFPFKLTRAGAAKVEEVRKSPPVANQFVGTWEGTLEAGQPLRLVLKISNSQDGASAVMVSVDQGGVEFPVTSIEQKDAKLTLVVKPVGGEYRAEINNEGTEIAGTWTQMGNDLPLKLKKAGAGPAKP